MKKNDNEGHLAEMRLELQKQINVNKVNIDYDCFRKTDQEKKDLKKAKKEYAQARALSQIQSNFNPRNE